MTVATSKSALPANVDYSYGFDCVKYSYTDRRNPVEKVVEHFYDYDKAVAFARKNRCTVRYYTLDADED